MESRAIGISVLAVVVAMLAVCLSVMPVRAEAGTEMTGPRNLTGESTAAGIRLSWDAPETGSPSGYRTVRRRPLEGENSLLVHVPDTGSDATEYTDRAVEDGVTYVYRVLGIDEAGVGPRSNFVRMGYTRPAGDSGAEGQSDSGSGSVPAKPVKVFAKVVQEGILITWEADAGDVTGYQILRRSPTQCEERLRVFVQDTMSTAGRWLDTEVEHGHKYVYRVKAINSNGVSKQSDYVRTHYYDRDFLAKSGDSGDSGLTPPVIRSVAAIGGKVLLEWDAPETGTATSYRIMRRAPHLCQDKFVIHVEDTGDTETVYVDSDVQMGKTYIYRIIAVNQAGFSDVSARSYKTVAPSAPALITVIAPRTVRPGTTDTMAVTASHLPLDDDPDTLDFTIRIDAMTLLDGEPDADADSCEGDGMGENHELWTVKSARTHIVFAFSDECARGEYRIKAVVLEGDGSEMLSLSWDHRVR